MTDENSAPAEKTDNIDRLLGEDVDGIVTVDVGEHYQRLLELAKLLPMEYDRERQAAAKAMGIRTSTLDDEVDKLRPEQAMQDNDSIVPPDPEPCARAVNAGDVLDAMVAMLRRFVVLPQLAAEAIALWSLHTWALDQFFVSPLLSLQSATKRCGKTTALLVVGELVRRPLIATNVTPAALFRTIELCEPTLLLDEADAWLRHDNDDLRALINAGHTRKTAATLRVVGDQHEPKRFSTWCGKVVAGIGKLSDTLQDRSIVIPLRRRRADEQVVRLPIDRLDGSAIRSMAFRWAQDNADALRYADPDDVPAELNDRAADNWRGLLSIADLAGAEWAERARRAACALNPHDDDDETVRVKLLADVASIVQRHNGRALSATVVAELADMEERPWPEWGRTGKPITQRALANQLRPFGIKPRTMRTATGRGKGYFADDLADSVSRYVPAVTPCQVKGDEASSLFPSVTGDEVSRIRSVTPPVDVTAENGLKPASLSDCHGVTDRKPENAARRKIRI